VISRLRRAINRIALVTNSDGGSGRISFPIAVLIVISHELAAEKYNSDESSARRFRALWFSLGFEMRL